MKKININHEKTLLKKKIVKKTQLQAARGLGYLVAQVVNLKINQVLKDSEKK
ncbi:MULTISPECIES: hypothetical protein [Bacillus cereus group]|uniref:hypothetical protein n=1 Tax=Bacillus cereus group TaxID=86661 RepID=UPI0022E29090|nr:MULTISPECIES: hypothetical protein [unclassified Bacillus cereus group]MDA2665752.1 hypothetical protein [Bacillus cereus group sp. Bc032]MDA2675803.1 hypothetical protein [Bacillus cereus group sp. Bc031]MDA2681267.1 hypothetical protein [Bacillus cereus group sp. Bc029]MDA2686723.1 hypothetical protein [Bacillus cereus group sp. Bc030]MDA2742262.1 hypothetical protein [Bacillus cereus group sp. Bc011]